MSKLLAYLDGELVGERQLDRERITIGRKPENDLQLAHEAISGRHAVITTIRNDSFLEDLHSTNGTRVNGKSIKKCLLRDGDEIKLAAHVLKYVFESLEIKPEGNTNRVPEKLRHLGNLAESVNDTLATHKDMLQTQAYLSTTQQISAGGRLPGKTASGEKPLAGLQILSGAGAGSEMELSRTMTTLGKPGIQVAVITRHPQGYTLAHIEGLQMPLVNGVAIGGEPRALEDRDIVEIAGVKLEFRLK